MYILFKRHGANHLFRNYQSKDELQVEVAKGHNEKFRGNNQFYYDTHSKVFEILNPRLTLSICQQRLDEARISQSVEEPKHSLRPKEIGALNLKNEKFSQEL